MSTGKTSALQIQMETRGPVLCLSVAGMAAAEVAGQLSRALQEAAQQSPKVLAVDLSELSFVSSMGLGGLVAAHVTCQKNNSLMVLVDPKPLILEILEVTKLNTLFKIVDTYEEAEQLIGG